MNLQKNFIRKIFSLKFKAKFNFSKGKSPEERLSSFIDEIIEGIKDPKDKIPKFRDESDKIKKIQLEVLAESENLHMKLRKADPEERLKAFQEKLQSKHKKYEDNLKENEEEEETEPVKKEKKNIKKKEKGALSTNQEEISDISDEENEEADLLNTKASLENDEFTDIKNLKAKKELNSEDKSSEKPSKDEKKAKSTSTSEEPNKEEEDIFAASSKGFTYIPPNLVIKTLIYPRNKTEVLLLGVERRNELHASYMIDMLQKLKVDSIVTQIAPDEPFFIKTEDEFKNAWERFLRGKFDYKFVINPNPETLADLILDTNRLKFLMDGSFLKSHDEFEMGSTFFYSLRAVTQKKEVDCFLTPLLYAYNNSDKSIPVVLNDFPKVLYREHIVRSITLDELMPLFESFVDEMQKGNTNYDPCITKPEIFIRPKIDYITEIIRQSCYLGKKVLAVVEMSCAEEVAETWKKQKKNSKVKSLQSLLANVETSKHEKNLTFTEYIQKHVILDLMLDDFVQDNFVEYKSFPFSGKGTIGKEMNFGNVFMIWNHYQRKFKKSKTTFKTFEELKNRVDSVPGSFVETDAFGKAFEMINKKEERKFK